MQLGRRLAFPWIARGSAPDEARERLMDAAIVGLQRWGLEKTGVGDIASEADVTKPTIYAYFEGHDDLLQIALHRAGAKLGERIVDEPQRFEDPGEHVYPCSVLGAGGDDPEPHCQSVTDYAARARAQTR